MSNNLVLHWKLDEIATPTATSVEVDDASGNDLNGTVHGFSDHLQLVPDEQFGSCLQFSGHLGGYVELPNFADFPGTEITTSCWINAEAADGVDSTPLSYASSDSLNNAWIMYNLANISPHVNNLRLNSEVNFADGQWHHLAISWQSNNGKVSVYKDGVRVFSGILRQGATIASSGSLVLGQEQDTKGGDFQANQAFIGKMAHVRVYNGVQTPEEIQIDIASDLNAAAAFQSSHPIHFQLLDENDRPNLYILDSDSGQKAKLSIKNISPQRLVFTAPNNVATAADANNYHLELRFRPGTLADDSLTALELVGEDWKLGPRTGGNLSPQQNTDGTLSYFLLSKTTLALIPSQQIEITLNNIGAAPLGGGRGTNALLGYRLQYSQESRPGSGSFTTLDEVYQGHSEQHISILNHRGQQQIPLHAGFVGSNRILKDGSKEDTNLTLRLTFQPRDKESQPRLQLKGNQAGTENGTTFFLSYDVQVNDATNSQKKEWALGTENDLNTLNVVVEEGGNWTSEAERGLSPVHKLILQNDVSLAAGEHIQLKISNFQSSLPNGYTNLYLHYQNIPGYWDGTFVLAVERAPLVFKGENVEARGDISLPLDRAIRFTRRNGSPAGSILGQFEGMALQTHNLESLILDQESPRPSHLSSAGNHWQSFTSGSNIGHSAFLHKIKIWNGDLRDGELRIYSGEGSNGELLLKQNYSLTSTNTWELIQLNKLLSIEPAHSYTIWFSNIKWHRTQGKYSKGTSSRGDTTDSFSFKTYIIPVVNTLVVSGENVGIGTSNPGFPLNFPNTLGDKISLWGQSGNHYGFGIQSSKLQIHTDTSDSDIVFGYGHSGQFTETVRFMGNGNVGIGTNNPTTGKLVIHTAAGATGLDMASSDSYANMRHIRNTQPDKTLHFNFYNSDSKIKMYTGGGTPVMTIANSRVGIGTTNPTQAKLVVAGWENSSVLPNYAYLMKDGGNNWGWVRGGDPSVAVSIWANEAVVSGNAFLAISDARVKNIIGVSNSKEDLELLQKIQVTDYSYKDPIAKGNRLHKKVIGQQIAKIFPQAVSATNKDVIPDIMQTTSVDENGWINLEHCLLAVGEKVKLIFEEETALLEVLDVNETGFQVDTKKTGKVFDYGREVEDFHVVDYEALSMLHISATQALIKQLEAQQVRLEHLESRFGKKELVV